MSRFIHTVVILLSSAVFAHVISANDFGALEGQSSFTEQPLSASDGTQGDRLWLLSTRHLALNSCNADLDHPDLRASYLDPCWNSHPVTLQELEEQLDPSRPLVIYVHGNRMDSCNLLNRARIVYRKIRSCRSSQDVDWVVFSWPSAKEGLLLNDFREKANRTNTQGLYLAWFLRRQVIRGISIVMIGYSYGARVVSGSLHALDGGHLAGRVLSGETLSGADVRVGLVAPAIGSNWLAASGFHGRATRNLDKSLVLYNRRDAVLKRYWRLDKIRNQTALGFTGPQYFGPRADGSRVKVYSRDCSVSVGLHHAEIDYYNCGKGNAQREMARLVDDSL